MHAPNFTGDRQAHHAAHRYPLMADSTPQITAAFGAPIRQYPGQVQVTRAVKFKVPGKEHFTLHSTGTHTVGGKGRMAGQSLKCSF